MFTDICRAFANFRDYRSGTVKHPLFGLLMILFLSRIAGCRGWDATADWVGAHFDLLRRHFDLSKRPPSADTLRRTAEAYDLDDFLDALVAEDATVHIDGKRARGANLKGQVHHFVEAFCGGKVIDMVETGSGAEGPAIKQLVKGLDLAGKLVTIDAAGTTPAVAAAVRGRAADVLLAVEGNQPSLLDAMRTAFGANAGRAHTIKEPWPRSPRDAQCPDDHGPEDRRTGRRHGQHPGYPLPVPHRAHPHHPGRHRHHYHISSRPLRPRQYARCVRSHWRIEAMHHVLDVSLGEDACRICTAAGVMGALRRLAYAVIAELRGAFSFRRFAEIVRANPTPLLEICRSYR